MYVCGITPYDATHLGHAFTYLTFDLINRTWRDLGLAVRYAQNVTDVDDPLLERAAATGVDWTGLAASETDVFRRDMTALRILPPDTFASVTESLPAIEDSLLALRDRGALYQVAGDYPDWYFSFAGRPELGAESHCGRDEMLKLFAEHGGDPDRTGKRDPLDALVWRQARPGEPSWASRLGRGRPGWHVQCAVIATGALGPTIDLQGGGSDLVFPHHDMCAVQARAITGERYARAFVHSAMVGLDGAKMSKSEGNLVKVSGLLEGGADPMAIRLALLGHHYRTDWEWTDRDVAGATARLGLWRRARRGFSSVDFASTADRVRRCLRNDLRADLALGAVDDWARDSLAAADDHPGARAQMEELTDGVLGVAVT